jgi:beta-lactamase class A
MMIDRRILLAGALSAIAVPYPRADAKAKRKIKHDASAELASIEARSKGRLGVTVLNTATGARLAHRGGERFPMLSTFKAAAAACVLSRVDRGTERLDRVVPYDAKDLVDYSPTTKARLGAGMTMADICEAAITLSDNTAGNLMLASFGGPAALTAYFRSLGDPVSRLDRTEPTLNEATLHDPRDTTTPDAMANTLRKLLLGDALSAKSRQQLIAWMVACKTGDARLRAGLPADWRAGDKTGTNGDRNCANDVAILWPPGRAPLIVTSYLAEAATTPGERDAVHASVGRVAVAWSKR